jgi:hypothetical protein
MIGEGGLHFLQGGCYLKMAIARWRHYVCSQFNETLVIKKVHLLRIIGRIKTKNTFAVC